MTFITDNTTILNQHNSFMCEKSHFKISAAVFSVLKDQQYIFKVDVADSIDFITADSIKKSIKTFINISLNDDLIIIIFNFIIYKLLKFKQIYK